MVCPNNAGSTGCGIYLTGPDVTALYNQGARRRLLARNLLARKLLQGDNCQTGAAKGALTGAITSMEACIPFLGPLYPFCMAGVIGVATAGGAAVGCAEANGCFPGTELHPSIAQLLARWTFSTGVMDPDARLDQPALTAYVGIRAFRTPSLTLRALAGDATVLLAGGEVKPMTSLALGDKVFSILCSRVIYVKRDMSWPAEAHQLVGFGCDPCGLVSGRFPVGSHAHERSRYTWNCYYLQPTASDITRSIMFELGIS